MSIKNFKTNISNLFTACRGGQILDPEEVQPEGTIKDFPNFDVIADCELLRDIIKGDLDPQEASQKITDIVAQRSNAQRQELKLQYAEMFEKADLVEDIKKEFGGQFLDVLIALFVYPSVLDAWTLNAAMKTSTDEHMLIDMIFTKTNEEILEITDAYETLYDQKLAAQLDSRPESCYVSKLMYSLCFANNESRVLVARVEHEKNDTKAKQDAETLQGDKDWASLDSYLNKILYQRGFEQMKLVFKAFEKISKESIEDRIKSSKLDVLLENILLTIVKCLDQRYVYYADRLHECMKGVGTNDLDLIQMIVSRSEVDLVQIKEAYLTKYGRSLSECVGEDIIRGGGKVAEHYRNIMVKLCTGSSGGKSQKSSVTSCISAQDAAP